MISVGWLLRFRTAIRTSLPAELWQAPSHPLMPFADCPLFRHPKTVIRTTHPHPRTRAATRPLSREIVRILRFGFVGGFGTLLNALLMWGLLSLGSTFLALNPSGHRVATAAALIAWIICCGGNFLLNSAWTFRAWPPSWHKAQQYYLSAALALVFQLFLLNFLLLVLETDRPIQTAVLNAVAVATGALLNYLFASLWVFRK